MKRAFIILVFCCSIAQAEPLADELSELNLPGRGQFGECVPFADALSTWLHDQGQSSQVIYYTYKPGLLHRPVTHAIVAWKRDGNWWAMGNELPRPRSLGSDANEPTIALAQRYDSRAYLAVTREFRNAGPLPIEAAGLIAVNQREPQKISKPEPSTVAPSHLEPLQPVATTIPTRNDMAVPVVAINRAEPPAEPVRRFYTDSNGTQILIQ